MPTVFDNSMVAHVWAQARQPYGRSNNGNLYFDGRTLYSYGTHFAVGHILKSGVVLLNSDSYSISTSRHQSEARAAVRHRETYYVPSLTELVNCRCLDLPSPDSIKAVESHIAAHAMQDETAVALMIAAGAKSGPKLAARVRRVKAIAKKAAEKEAARLDAAERKNWENRARHLAGISDKDFSAWLNRLIDNSWTHRSWSHSGKLKGALPDASRDVGRWHKAAKARGWTAMAARVFARLRVIRETMKTGNLDARKKAITRNLRTRENVFHVRAAFATLASGESLGSSQSYRTFSERLAHLALRVPTLAAYRDAAMVESDRLRVLERAAAERAAAERAAAREAARIEAAKNEAERRANWFAGLPHAQWSGRDENGNAYIRAVDVARDAAGVIVSGMLETSQGADVPLTHAIRAFRFIKLCRTSGRAWRANGHAVRVGHFAIDWIDAEGNFKAGCHMFAWPEIERVATALGVFDVAPDKTALEPSHAAA